MLESLSRRGGEFINFFGLYVLHSSVLDEVFVISGIIKVEVAEADDTYRDLEIPDITKSNLITVLLHIVLKKISTNKPSHRTQFNIALGSHALSATYRLVSFLLANN